MKASEIIALMQSFRAERLKSLKLKIADFELELQAAKANSTGSEKAVETQKDLKPAAELELANPPEANVKTDLYSLRAPLVGSFYRQMEEGAKPFVEVGSKVQEGETVCIIEAMKMMNHIEAPCSGTIASIQVENAAFVEYDQLLMEIEVDA